MASEQAAVSAVTAPTFPTNLPEPATLSSPSNNPPDSDSTRTKSLKRSRPDQSQNSNLTSIAHAGLGRSPSPKSPRYKGTFAPSFAPLTGAAALADERRKKAELAREVETGNPGAMTENPGHKAIASLMAGGGAEMSRPQDAPVATTAMSEGMTKAANVITVPSSSTDTKAETSPASVTSLASLGSTAQTATASPTIVGSPAAMTSLSDNENRDARPLAPNNQLKAPIDDHGSNRALSFPGQLLAQPDPSRLPPRGLSLPMPSQNQQLAPRSPSQKKHKCPYCDTEFTRHHNLKSHLLTHSQEKPYVCQSCQMRFRRLHDLKRHMKLHTGERPHICPKCDRKFARGDALARHSKGQGGCAGRRASMGSGFGGDDDYEGSNAGDDDGGMDGVMYTNGTPHGNDSEMTEEERRRFSLPSIKAQHVSSNQGSGDSYTSHSRTPSTYPPAGPRPVQPSGGLYPPNTDRGNSSSTGTSSLQSHAPGNRSPGGSLSSMAVSTASGSMFSQSGMTESPKPLSPAGMHSHQLGHDSINRQRSPSLTTQFQQQHFGRRQSGRASPTSMSLPSPHSSQGPRLPGLANLQPPDQRYTLSSQIPSSNGGSQPQSAASSPSTAFQPPRSGGPGPLQQQGSSSGDSSNNVFAGGDKGIWAYAHNLEERARQLTEDVENLKNENQALLNERKQSQDQIMSQQDQIKRLSEELTFFRNQQQSSQLQPPASGSS